MSLFEQLQHTISLSNTFSLCANSFHLRCRVALRAVSLTISQTQPRVSAHIVRYAKAKDQSSLSPFLIPQARNPLFRREFVCAPSTRLQLLKCARCARRKARDATT